MHTGGTRTHTHTRRHTHTHTHKTHTHTNTHTHTYAHGHGTHTRTHREQVLQKRLAPRRPLEQRLVDIGKELGRRDTRPKYVILRYTERLAAGAGASDACTTFKHTGRFMGAAKSLTQGAAQAKRARTRQREHFHKWGQPQCFPLHAAAAAERGGRCSVAAAHRGSSPCRCAPPERSGDECRGERKPDRGRRKHVFFAGVYVCVCVAQKYQPRDIFSVRPLSRVRDHRLDRVRLLRHLEAVGGDTTT